MLQGASIRTLPYLILFQLNNSLNNFIIFKVDSLLRVTRYAKYGRNTGKLVKVSEKVFSDVSHGF